LYKSHLTVTRTIQGYYVMEIYENTCSLYTVKTMRNKNYIFLHNRSRAYDT